jgi:hypothetical protein
LLLSTTQANQIYALNDRYRDYNSWNRVYVVEPGRWRETDIQSWKESLAEKSILFLKRNITEEKTLLLFTEGKTIIKNTVKSRKNIIKKEINITRNKTNITMGIMVTGINHYQLLYITIKMAGIRAGHFFINSIAIGMFTCSEKSISYFV